MQSPIQWARAYAEELGWAVFPIWEVDAGVCACPKGSKCKSPGKHPRTKHGFKNASDLVDDVETWWTAHPLAHIGIRTGETTFIALDFDDPAQLAAFEAVHGPFTGPLAKTGGGGWHALFLPPGIPVPCRQGIAPGVDVRGDGGYVVAPPSGHVSGEVYGWVRGPETPLQAIPASLLELLAGAPALTPPALLPPAPEVAGAPAISPATEPPPVVDVALEEIVSALAVIPALERQIWLEVGMALHSTRDPGARAAWDAWSRTCPEKFDPDDQEKTWRGFHPRANDIGIKTLYHIAYQHGWGGWQTNGHVPAEPAVARESFEAATPPPMPFPIAAALPPALSWLRDWWQAVAHAYQVPTDMPAMLCLPYVSVAIAKHLEIHIVGTWREQSALWTLIPMESGERKSAILHELAKPLFAWQIKERARADEAIATWTADYGVATRMAKEAIAKASKDGNVISARHAELEVQRLKVAQPFRPQIVVTDATNEGIAKALSRNHERLLLAAPEADALEVVLGRYSVGNQSAMGAFLSGHAGDHFAPARVGDGSPELDEPALSVALAPQPDSVQRLLASPEAHAKGFCARFLYAMPASRMGWREIVPQGVPESLEVRWHRALTWLLERPFPARPESVRLSQDALSLFLAFAAEIEEAMRTRFEEGSRTSPSPAWYSKLPGAIARIALTLYGLQVADDPRRAAEVDVDTMEAALAWAPYLEAHHRRAMGAEDRDSGIARRVLDWLERTGIKEFSRRQAFQALKGPRRSVSSVRDIEEALRQLVDGRRLEALASKRSDSHRYRFLG